MPGFLFQIYQNIIRIFKGRNLLWHFLAIALTFFFVASGFDWYYFVLTQKPIFYTLLFPAVILGGLLPIIFTLLLLTIGFIKKNLKIKNIAYAIGQSAILGLLISSFYKAFTGRIPPPHHLYNVGVLSDISHEFQFGFLHGGVFWGWPSSHTTVAFAVALAVWKLFPENKLIRCGAILYAFYIGIGVSMSIHWFSEFAAGAIIGSLIGAVVGKSFKNRFN